jgi:hypothetical protein
MILLCYHYNSLADSLSDSKGMNFTMCGRNQNYVRSKPELCAVETSNMCGRNQNYVRSKPVTCAVETREPRKTSIISTG